MAKKTGKLGAILSYIQLLLLSKTKPIEYSNLSPIQDQWYTAFTTTNNIILSTVIGVTANTAGDVNIRITYGDGTISTFASAGVVNATARTEIGTAPRQLIILDSMNDYCIGGVTIEIMGGNADPVELRLFAQYREL